MELQLMISIRPKETPDEIFYKTLGNIVHHVKTPITVGLYGSCKHRLEWFMKKIKKHVLHVAEQRELEWKYDCSHRYWILWFCHQFCLKLMLLWQITMYVPSIKLNETKNHYIFVPFKAWEFVGSDFLWAGLVTTLFEDIEKKYKWPLTFFKVFGIPVQDPKDNSKQKMCQRIKRYLKRLLFGFLLFSFIISAGIAYLLGWHVIKKEFILSVGTLLSCDIFLLLVNGLYNFIYDSRAKINKLMNKNQFSDQLGFMHSVKEEIKILTNFLGVLGVYKKWKIKVVLQISHLEACPPEKVMSALEALHILLSDPEAPFICILAADSMTIAKSLEKSERVGTYPGSGYHYLDQLISLPFSVPHMNDKDKKKLIRTIITKDENQEQEEAGESSESQSGDQQDENHHGDLEDVKVIKELQNFLSNKETFKYLPDNKVHMNRLLYYSWWFKSVLRNDLTEGNDEDDKAKDKDEKAKDDDEKTMFQWVLLATRWPFRVSWMLQCAEDDKQWRKIYGVDREQNDLQCSDTQQETTDSRMVGSSGNENTNTESHNSIKLEDSLQLAFDKSASELDGVKEKVKKLMELDADHEIFLQLLKDIDKKFIVKKALDYWGLMTNLDKSIKRQIELIRNSQMLKQVIRNNDVPPFSLLKMSTEDVCRELQQNVDKMGISEANMVKYIERIRKQNLNGRALVYSLSSEIKETLDMTLGDWANFSFNFLKVLPAVNLIPCLATLREKPGNKNQI